MNLSGKWLSITMIWINYSYPTIFGMSNKSLMIENIENIHYQLTNWLKFEKIVFLTPWIYLFSFTFLRIKSTIQAEEPKP